MPENGWRFGWHLGLCWFLAVAPGCGAGGDGHGENLVSGSSPEGGDSGVATEEIELTLVDAAGLEAALSRHRGRVILLDFWATWCGPCVARFPHVVELSRNRRRDGLAVVSLSLDDPSEAELVRQFLAKQNASFDHLMSKLAVEDLEFVETFQFRGGPPLYRLYDRTGEMRYQFSETPQQLENGLAFEELEKRIDELLNEQRAVH